MKSFLTGSHVYGSPSADSDIDLVICVSKRDKQLLVKLSDNKSFPLRFGKLNLILARSKSEFESWKEGTKLLIKRKPVTREEAVKQFNELGIGVDEEDTDPISESRGLIDAR